VFERILKQVRDNILKRNYVMTLHAEEEMDDEDLTIYDVEHGILTGKIVELRRIKLPQSGNIASEGRPPMMVKLT
jgi:hypothetical protein